MEFNNYCNDNYPVLLTFTEINEVPLRVEEGWKHDYLQRNNSYSRCAFYNYRYHVYSQNKVLTG